MRASPSTATASRSYAAAAIQPSTFRLDREDYDGIRNPDDDSQRAGEYAFKVEYSVSGTTYTPAEMAVVMKINQELMDAGNELTMLMAQEKVIWTWGIPEAVEVPAASAAGGPEDDRLN